MFGHKKPEPISSSLHKLLNDLAKPKAMRASSKEDLDHVIEPAELDRISESERQLHKAFRKMGA